jgi:hypothetical protein
MKSAFFLHLNIVCFQEIEHACYAASDHNARYNRSKFDHCFQTAGH